MTMRSLSAGVLMAGLISGCAEQAETPAPVVVSSDTARVIEVFITTPIPADNIDSPAIYHGPDGIHWVIATAKETHQLVVFDAITGAEVRRVGQEGRGPGEFLRPNGIQVLDDSLLLVVERDNRRVQGFRMPGFEPIGSFGTEVLRKPYGLSAFREGERYRLYVTDNYETPEEGVPPLAELGERIKWFHVTISDGQMVGHFAGAFGDTSVAGAIQVTESILADPANDRLLIAEELEVDSYLKVYTLDGHFTGEVVGRGLFPQQAEGIALYTCGDRDGYWIATDQGPEVNTFHLFDRMSFAHIASFAAARTNTTDGIVVTQRAFGPFSAGAFYMAHSDAAVSALAWADIAASTGIRQDCIHGQ